LPLPRSSAPTADAPVRRGDWIEVRGLGMCCVRSVHQGRGVLRADVEVAKDLTQRSVDLRRASWRKIER
jgi:small-conductance mechanosensitive channel